MMRMVVLVAYIAACGGSHPRSEAPPPVEPTKTPAPDAGASPDAPEATAAPELTCDSYDPKNPACAHDCRYGHCACPSPPNIHIPACWAIMPCPDPPDRRVRACELASQPRDPVLARVVKTEPHGADAIVTLSAGGDSGVTRDWHGVVLAGDSDSPLAELVVLAVGRRQTVARVHLGADQIANNPRVRLTPPP